MNEVNLLIVVLGLVAIVSLSWTIYIVFRHNWLFGVFREKENKLVQFINEIDIRHSHACAAMIEADKCECGADLWTIKRKKINENRG